MRTVFAKRRSIQLFFMTCVEDLDLADDLALMSHRIQNIRDKIQALEEQGMHVHRPEDQCHKLERKLMCIGTR